MTATDSHSGDFSQLHVVSKGSLSFGFVAGAVLGSLVFKVVWDYISGTRTRFQPDRGAACNVQLGLNFEIMFFLLPDTDRKEKLALRSGSSRGCLQHQMQLVEARRSHIRGSGCWRTSGSVFFLGTAHTQAAAQVKGVPGTQLLSKTADPPPDS